MHNISYSMTIPLVMFIFSENENYSPIDSYFHSSIVPSFDHCAKEILLRVILSFLDYSNKLCDTLRDTVVDKVIWVTRCKQPTIADNERFYTKVPFNFLWKRNRKLV